jgi:uncharacterized protein YcfL
MKKLLLLIVLSVLVTANASSQTLNQKDKSFAQNSVQMYKYSVSTTYLSFLNFEMGEAPNTYHYELHIKYRLTPKDKIGIKLAKWNMFEPMGIPMQEVLKFDENNYYPGRVREAGIGVTYQRMIWKGLYLGTEILPQLKTYLDEDNHKINNGFKLYTSYHLGYHVPLFKNRVYLEPQVHCQYWPIDTNTPQSFKVEDDKWNNYFLFEPDLYLGVNFNY